MYTEKKEMYFLICISCIHDSSVERKVTYDEKGSKIDPKKYSEGHVLNLDVRITWISTDHFFPG